MAFQCLPSMLRTTASGAVAQLLCKTAKCYVQPRSSKMSSRIGIGIPSSQSKMYPVAPQF